MSDAEVYTWHDNPTLSGISECDTNVLNECLMHLKYCQSENLTTEEFITTQNQKEFVLSKEILSKTKVVSVNINNHNILPSKYEIDDAANSLILINPLEEGCEVAITYLAGRIVANDAVLTNSFRHDQLEETQEIRIKHNLGRYPQVSIADIEGNIVEADVKYIDDRNIQILFTPAFKGHVYLI